MKCKCDVLEDFNKLFETAQMVVSSYIDYFRNELGHPEIENDGRHYGFIPTGGLYHLYIFRRLYKVLEAKKLKNKRKTWLERKEKPRFLDAGCGIGNMLLLAEACGFRVSGIELDKKTHKIAEKLLHRDRRFYDGGRDKVFHGDILKFNKYKQYDVIYFYQPMSNGPLMSRFVWKLVKEMKVGAFIVPNGLSGPFRTSGLFEDVSPEFNVPGGYERAQVLRKVRQKKKVKRRKR